MSGFLNEKTNDFQMENLTKKEIDGITFQIQLMPALKSAVLDRKIICILAPGVGNVASNGIDTELNLESLFSGLSAGLASLDDTEYEKLIGELLCYVSAVTKEGVFELDNTQAINKVFQKKLLTLYKVIIEVMKFNGFSVFGLVAGGKGMSLISMLNTVTTKTKVPGSESEKLEN